MKKLKIEGKEEVILKEGYFETIKKNGFRVEINVDEFGDVFLVIKFWIFKLEIKISETWS